MRAPGPSPSLSLELLPDFTDRTSGRRLRVGVVLLNDGDASIEIRARHQKISDGAADNAAADDHDIVAMR